MKKFLPGNRITLLKNGAEYFPALEAAFARIRRQGHAFTVLERGPFLELVQACAVSGSGA